MLPFECRAQSLPDARIRFGAAVARTEPCGAPLRPSITVAGSPRRSYRGDDRGVLVPAGRQAEARASSARPGLPGPGGRHPSRLQRRDGTDVRRWADLRRAGHRHGQRQRRHRLVHPPAQARRQDVVRHRCPPRRRGGEGSTRTPRSTQLASDTFCSPSVVRTTTRARRTSATTSSARPGRSSRRPRELLPTTASLVMRPSPARSTAAAAGATIRWGSS
jgi:hypothetical protein